MSSQVESAQAIDSGTDREALDADYNNMRAVPNAVELLAGFRGRAEHTYARAGWRRDLQYGPGERQRYDALVQAPGRPVFVFIHGGYWQRCTKEDFAFVAEGPIGAGYNVVLVEYTLAPAATIPGIVAEVGMLLQHLARDADALGLGDAPMVFSGHSAGGHLAAMWRAHPRVKVVMSISGLFELEPIRLCYLNDGVRLSFGDAAACSPQRLIGKGAPTLIALGGAELPGLVRQSADYAKALRQSGEMVQHLSVEDLDHFRVLEDLARPDGAMLTRLAEILSS